MFWLILCTFKGRLTNEWALISLFFVALDQVPFSCENRNGAQHKGVAAMRYWLPHSDYWRCFRGHCFREVLRCLLPSRGLPSLHATQYLKRSFLLLFPKVSNEFMTIFTVGDWCFLLRYYQCPLRTSIFKALGPFTVFKGYCGEVSFYDLITIGDWYFLLLLQGSVELWRWRLFFVCVLFHALSGP